MSRLASLVLLYFLSTGMAAAGPLHDAAKAGDVDQIMRHLNDGADVNEADNFGTALHWAAMNGHLAAIDALVQKGADLETATDFLGTPLHAAALRGQAEAVASLARHGANTDARKSDGATPLSVAAGGNRIEVAKALIAAGADVNAVTTPSSGQIIGDVTALHIALRFKNLELAQVLRDADAVARPIQPSPPELASADPDRGLIAARSWCAACHIVEADAVFSERLDHFDGPTLVGIHGQPVGASEGYDYSPELRAFGGTWTNDRLFAFITQPMLTVPGTKMSWHDGWSEREAADIVAFLRGTSR